ncbi:hypothetical protein LPJ60_003598 [Coemansia sp. RSA 2675]|nr:hypothetical protein LPJ60_003598 [Coemansia sp. RSA 2675]
MALKPDASSHNETPATPASPNPDTTVATPAKMASSIMAKPLVLPLSPPLDDAVEPHEHKTLLDEAQGSGISGDSTERGASRVALANGDLLPTNVTPSHYDLHLEPDLAIGIVHGSVAVDALVNEETEQIVLHAKSIVIAQVLVYHSQVLMATVAGKAVIYEDELEMATIPLPCVLRAHDLIQIVITYTGVLSESMYGLYRCKYRDRMGDPSTMLVTQFQAKCARLAFPCWDEPAFKAEFTLALTVPSSHTALSNMPVVRETEDCEGAKTVYFERSPRMSTYLLAIISGELDYIEATTLTGNIIADSDPPQRAPVPCRVYTAAADIDKVQFSLDTAVKVLELLVDMFGCAYPLPKLDLVAVPELEAGGMENWGLILFRTVRLFITSQTSLWIRQKAVYVIAHELSHQWFGNLVTMAWWDDLWLNEGFATWIGIHITDLMYPEWRRWDHFAIEDRQAALSADSLRSSHPVQVTIKGSADIDQVFDSITYYKGCSLIRMLSAHLGTDAFMAGIRAYLNAHAYASATTSDLWVALETASGQPVAELMRSWTTCVGYPVVSVDADFETGELRLTQNRFLHSGHVTPEEDSTLWWVPLGMVSSESAHPVSAVLHDRSGSFVIPGSPAATWIKLNYNNAGLYRVRYSRDALRRLASAAASGNLMCTADAVGILNDAIALAISGHVPTSAVLDMVTAFQERQPEFVVLQILGLFLESLHQTWADRSPPAVREHIRALARSLFASQAAALGWTHRPGDSPMVARLRVISIPRAAWAGDAQVIAQALEYFEQFYSAPTEPKPFHHDFTASVFEIAVRCGPVANHARVRDMYEHSARWHLSEDHRMAALGAMACSRDPSCMWQTLDYALSDHVLPQDLNIVMGFMVTADHRSKHILWRWFKLNYQRLVARLGEASALLGHVVSTVIGDFATPEMADDVETWFADKHTAAFDRSLPQSLEFIRVRAAWFERDSNDVQQWFEGFSGESCEC